MRQQAWAVGLLVAAAVRAPVRAEMKDWQLRRVPSFRTERQMDDFVDKSGPTGPGRCHAIYPHGVDLECPGRTNERTCRILTKPPSFDNLGGLGHDRPK